MQEVHNDEFIDHDIFDNEYYESLVAEVQSMFEEINETNLIHGISLPSFDCNTLNKKVEGNA